MERDSGSRFCTLWLWMGCEKVTYDELRYPPARGSDSATLAKGRDKDTA